MHWGHSDATREVQCIATSTDGVRFEKYSGNPVIAAPPAEATAGFGDPKVWKDADGLWKMVVGSGHEGRGKALLNASEDLRRWTSLGRLAEGDGTNGGSGEAASHLAVGWMHCGRAFSVSFLSV